MLCARRLASLAWVASALLLAPAAWARVEVVSWSYELPCSVDRFELHYGSAPTSLDNVLDVGRPRQAGGHFSWELEVPDGQETWVCVTAIRGNETSECSNLVTVEAGVDDDLRSEPAPGAAERNWCDDFAGGVARSGWVDTGPGSSLDPESGHFRIASLGRSNPALVSSSGADDVHSHYLSPDDRGTPSAQWTRYEYSGQMMFADDEGGVGATVYSLFDSAASYYRLAREPGTGSFVLERDHVDPSYRCFPAAEPVSTVPGEWYAFRIRVKNEGDWTALHAKVWPASRREPEDFQLFCTDRRPARQASGAVGVWAAGIGLKAWDDLHVSALSDPADSDPLGAPGQPELVP